MHMAVEQFGLRWMQNHPVFHLETLKTLYSAIGRPLCRGNWALWSAHPNKLDDG